MSRQPSGTLSRTTGRFAARSEQPSDPLHRDVRVVEGNAYA